MAINDEIAAGGRPVQFENPLNNMVKFSNIQNDMANMAIHKQKLAEDQRLQGLNVQFGLDLANLGDSDAPEYENKLRQAYINKGDPKGYQEHKTAALANKNTEADILKKREETAGQAYRNISQNPSPENIIAHNQDFQLNRNNSPQDKAKSQRTTDMLVAMPLDQRVAWLASQGASAADLKPTMVNTGTGTLPTGPYSGRAVAPEIRTGLTPAQQLEVPVGYDQASASLQVKNDSLKAKLAEINAPGTTPARAQALEAEIQQDRRSIAAQQQDQESMRLAAQQAKQPLDAKERLMKNYYAGIAAGRSPKDPEMMDMMAQIEHNRSFAPPARTDIKVNSYEPASVAAQKDFILESAKQRTALRNSKGAIDNINKAITLIPSSAQFMGPGGEPLLNATSFLNNRLGLSINTKGVTDATELRSRMFNNIIDTLKKLDSTPTQKQQDTLQEALGTLGTDPNALPNVLRAFQDVIRGKVEDYNADVTEAEKRGVKFPYKPQIDLGEYGGRTPPTSAAVAYLKANPATRALYDDKYGPGASDKILQGK